MENDEVEPVRVLAELRPTIDGHYGIPQETRLLFAALAGSDLVRLEGLLQMSTRPTLGGVAIGDGLSVAEEIQCYARTVISIKGKSAAHWRAEVSQFINFIALRWSLRLSALCGLGKVQLRHFRTLSFEDFIWQNLFARSLPTTDRELVLARDHRICPAPWRFMHMVGLERRGLLRRAAYPRLDTHGIDIFISQTPCPARVSEGTALVVHYHDAIPVFMPHTISDRAFHEASHFNALSANVRDGAWFVCVSEATRQDLLRLFPQVEAKSVTIHNMVPAHYYPSEPEYERLPSIMRRYQYGEFIPAKSKKDLRSYRLTKSFTTEQQSATFFRQSFANDCRYLLMVSTIEPRKNHLRLLEAWEVLRDLVDHDLKLVLVGNIGWDYKSVLDACQIWIEQGGLFMLHDVPADALRILYRQALVTVCPSLGEGFDFAGIEAMRCAGVVAASDIPVHREIYSVAAEYFDAYDTKSLVEALRSLIDAPDAAERREALRAAGVEQSVAYSTEYIAPQWLEFLHRVFASQKVSGKI